MIVVRDKTVENAPTYHCHKLCESIMPVLGASLQMWCIAHGIVGATSGIYSRQVSAAPSLRKIIFEHPLATYGVAKLFEGMESDTNS